MVLKCWALIGVAWTVTRHRCPFTAKMQSPAISPIIMITMRRRLESTTPTLLGYYSADDVIFRIGIVAVRFY